MSTSTTILAGTEEHGSNYLNAKKGIASWLVTVDHKRIGVMYLAWILTFFLLNESFSLLTRALMVAPTVLGTVHYL